MDRPMLSRRQWLKLSAAGVVAHSLSGWIETLAADAAADPGPQARSCILLWMTGGPSQIDTFDLKPGHANGGPYKPIETAVPGHQDQRAPAQDRPRDGRPGDRPLDEHEGRGPRPRHVSTSAPATCRTGPIQYPALGSLVAKEFERDDAELPNFVSVAPFRFFNPAAYGPGFLGPQYAPLVVGEQNFGQVQGQAGPSLKVEDLDSPAGRLPHAGGRPARPARGPGGRLPRRGTPA